jgi:hypothetical protein
LLTERISDEKCRAKYFKAQGDVNGYPCPSSKLGIYFAYDLDVNSSEISVDILRSKCFDSAN